MRIITQYLILAILTQQTAHAAVSGPCVNPFELALSPTVKMTFCEIPASAEEGFTLGDDQQWSSPQVLRKFKKFHIGKFEVTQQQYSTIVEKPEFKPWAQPVIGFGFNGAPNVQAEPGGATPWLNTGSPIGDNIPATMINFVEAEAFARFLNTIDPSAVYRLPTEYEFEYALRGGTHTKYFWGDDMDPAYAAYDPTWGSRRWLRSPPNLCKPAPVDTCPLPGKDCANQYGLFHMIGNVMEWTRTYFTPYHSREETDGHAYNWSVQDSFTVRGGTCASHESAHSSSSRWGEYRAYRNPFLGFRVVRIPR